MTDLLPCPNCGAKVTLKNNICWVISCLNCGLEVVSKNPSGEELKRVESVWNNLPRRIGKGDLIEVLKLFNAEIFELYEASQKLLKGLF